MRPLSEQFVRTFQKAISTEMAAMQERLGPFEVPIEKGRIADVDEKNGAHSYAFEVAASNDKLMVGIECTLVYDDGELLVTISALEGTAVTIRCDQKIALNCNSYMLVIYPWFLYERLKVALESLLGSEQFSEEHALRTFGKIAPDIRRQPLRNVCSELNLSQRKAIELCAGSDLAFVWGPPGTGKTTTLGYIVTELLAQGARILVTSTTNAAVDQALAKLGDLEAAATFFERGEIVRIGQGHGETFGANLRDVVLRLNSKIRDQIERLHARCSETRNQVRQCERLLDKLEVEMAPLQSDLFTEARDELVTQTDLATVFSERAAQRILNLPTNDQKILVTRRKARLETVCQLALEKSRALSRELGNQEQAIVKRAKVVLATMTNMYMSSLLVDERFDVVIVEEAGMAILPTVFYCAALARTKVLLVGDPKQLPPIVQSNANFVHKAMGRSIFEVTAPDPHTCEFVAMLDTQYRMHPHIGELVSTLFYDARLRHGEGTEERNVIAEKAPFPGEPVVVVDTESGTRCERPTGSYSRFNEATAEFCVELAAQAVRDGIASVAIITPYAEQSRLIRRLLAQARQDMRNVECQTVHRFQGNERDLVILDTVDTAPMKPGVLLSGDTPRSASANLLNVSISRARGKLVILADVAYFRTKAPDSTLNEVIDAATEFGQRLRWTDT